MQLQKWYQVIIPGSFKAMTLENKMVQTDAFDAREVPRICDTDKITPNDNQPSVIGTLYKITGR